MDEQSDKLTAIVQRMIDAGESEANIATVIRASQPKPPSVPDTAIGMSAAGGSVPLAANMAERVATSPTLPKTVATIGRTIGAIAPAAGGIASGNPLAAVNGVMAAGQGAWTGGKGGWFTGKLLQNAAAPVATALRRAAPYAQALSTVSGAQGVNDLAQMAEPNRTDIGVLGVGASPTAESMHMTPEQFAQAQEAHPPLLNDIYRRVKAKLSGRD